MGEWDVVEQKPISEWDVVSQMPLETGGTKQTEQESLTFKKALGQAMVNYPASLGKLGINVIKGTADVLSLGQRDTETSAMLGNVLRGIAEKVIPDEQANEKYADALWQHYKKKWGSWEGFKKALATDPADIMNDASTVLLGVAGATKFAPKVSQIASQMGQIVEPTTAITAPIKMAGKLIPKDMTKSLYTSSLKPKGDTLAETLAISEKYLGREYPVSLKSWRATQTHIKRLKETVKGRIERGTETGDKIDITDIVQGLDDLKANQAFADWKPDLLERVIDRTKKNLIEWHMKQSGGKLTPAQVQDLKVRQWRDVEKNFGEISLVYKDEIQKALGHSAKLTLEKLYPDIKNTNIAMGELLEFNKHLEKSLQSHLTADEVRNIAFMIKAVIDNPAAKSKVAIWLNRAKRNHPLANKYALEKDLAFQFGKWSTQPEGQTLEQPLVNYKESEVR